MTESRAPISLPSYVLGDAGKPSHFDAATPRETAAEEAKSLQVGDAAFILRSDHKWAYAIVAIRDDSDTTILRFEVDYEKNRKSFPEGVWGKYIRVIKIDADELVKLEAEAGANEPEEDIESEQAKVETKEETKGGAKKKESKSTNKTDKKTLILGEFSSEVGSWFSSKFNSKKPKESKSADVAAQKEDTPKPQTEEKDTLPSQEKSQSKPDVAATEDKKPDVAATEGKKKSKASEIKRVSSSTKDKNKLSASFFTSLFTKKSRSFEEPKQDTKKGEEKEPAAAAEKSDDKSKVNESEGSEPTVAPPEEQMKEESAKSLDEGCGQGDALGEVEGCMLGAVEGEVEGCMRGLGLGEESRDEVEEKSDPAPTPVVAEPEVPKPVPIQLLQTPIQFYKASTMQEDPAAAALAATSFADETDCYGFGPGITVVENDPTAAVEADKLARERIWGPLEKEGITIVEADSSVCSVHTVEAE